MMRSVASSGKPARHQGLQLLGVDAADGGLVGDVSQWVVHLDDRHRPGLRLALDDLLAVDVATCVRRIGGERVEDFRLGIVAQGQMEFSAARAASPFRCAVSRMVTESSPRPMMRASISRMLCALTVDFVVEVDHAGAAP